MSRGWVVLPVRNFSGHQYDICNIGIQKFSLPRVVNFNKRRIVKQQSRRQSLCNLQLAAPNEFMSKFENEGVGCDSVVDFREELEADRRDEAGL